MNIKCSECDQDINGHNIIMRCCDATVCSIECSNHRYRAIHCNGTFHNITAWENTSYYLIDPVKTTRVLSKIPSFVPIYVNDRKLLNNTPENEIKMSCNTLNNQLLKNITIYIANFITKINNIYM